MASQLSDYITTCGVAVVRMIKEDTRMWRERRDSDHHQNVTVDVTIDVRFDAVKNVIYTPQS